MNTVKIRCVSLPSHLSNFKISFMPPFFDGFELNYGAGKKVSIYLLFFC